MVSAIRVLNVRNTGEPGTPSETGSVVSSVGR